MKTSQCTRLALFGGIALLTNASSAQTWHTVDDYQFIAGEDSQNQALAVAPGGVLFAAGVDNYWGVGLVMASSDNGTTWSAPLDTLDFAGWGLVNGAGISGVFNCAGIVSDPAGNLYAAYTGYPSSESGMDMHWLVRRSTDGGLTWTTVDDFDPGGVYTQVNSITTDAAGNVYVAGIAQYRNGTGGWTVRKGIGGTNFSTVDTIALGGIGAQAVFAHPTAGVFAVGSGQTGKNSTWAWVVRRSTNGGATWSTVDNFQLSSMKTSRAQGIGADALGNIYVVGTGWVPSKGTAHAHWAVRKSSNGGNSWSTVDTYQLAATGNSEATGFVADSQGNLFAVGSGSATTSGPTSWIVRENPGGTGGWQTVDTLQYVSGASSQPQAIAANASGNVFVGGWGSDGTSTHWLVRRK